ncbi:MAG TPA: PepSY domain-containing protein [Chloroflexota bacterium]
MVAKTVLYGAGLIGATVGALLAGQVALQPVFAQAAAPGAAPAAEEPAAADPAAADAPADPAAADAPADPAGDADEAAALKARAKLSQDEALKVALAQYPGGTVQSTTFGDENGLVVYEFIVSDSAGARHKVKVDANTGAIVHAPDD